MINRIVKWNKDRLLDKQEFDLRVETINIIEELIEINYTSLKSDKARALANQIYGFINSSEQMDKDNVIDGLCDIVVYAIGSMYKLGYEPNECMDETLKEIETRTGSIIDGKFIKDKSREAKTKWYKADYTKCKRIE